MKTPKNAGRPQPEPEPSAESKESHYALYERNAFARVKSAALAAIEAMRHFLEEAEQDIDRPNTTPERMVSSVVSALAHGQANAASQIHSALSALEDVRKVREHAAKEL